MSDKTEVEDINEIINLRETLEIAKKNCSDLRTIIDKKEDELYATMEAKGEKSLSTETHTVTCVRPKLNASVLVENRERLLKWIDDEQGRPDLITTTVNAKTLSKYIKEELYPKGFEPPEFIKIFMKKDLQIRKREVATDGN